MKLHVLFVSLGLTLGASASAQSVLVKKLDRYSSNASQESNKISPERKELLTVIADKIISAKMKEGNAAVMFVCANNSAASQMAQAWMQVAIEKYNLTGVQAYSAGLNPTAIDKSTIDALEKSGFKVEANATYANNPRYMVRYSWQTNSILMFSKKADNYQIPTTGVIAIAVDNSTLPTMEMAKLPYNSENALEASAQIAREVFFIAEKVQNSHMLSHQQ